MTDLSAKLRRIEALRSENQEDAHPSFVRIEAASRKIVVEKDIPIPALSNRFPWGTMDVGDSFVVPGKIQTAKNAAVAYGRRHGIKFTFRKVAKDQYRVWRIS